MYIITYSELKRLEKYIKEIEDKRQAAEILGLWDTYDLCRLADELYEEFEFHKMDVCNLGEICKRIDPKCKESHIFGFALLRRGEELEREGDIK